MQSDRNLSQRTFSATRNAAGIANAALNPHPLWQSVLAVLAFFSLNLLLVINLGSANEVDVLPLAKQFADPNWMPQDWYLNQPPGYRLVFQSLFGWLIVQWGFLATSIVGRLFCYSLVALGLVLIARKLNLSLLLLLMAITLFLAHEGVAAGEWLILALEAKAVAYGLILLAINLMLAGRFVGMALLLGIATSFHVLVGGWAFLTALGWLALKPKTRLRGIRRLGLIVLCYLVGSSFALPSIVQQLFTPTPLDAIAPSFVYVFLRLPHHLNPLFWSPESWIAIVLYLLILAVSVAVLRRSHRQRLAHATPKELLHAYTAQIELCKFTLISLVPFALGIVIAPFDSEGKLLQYYPFRFGDVMLPLTDALLFACALQTLSNRARRGLVLVWLVILGAIVPVQSVRFMQQLIELRQFPGVQQDASPEWKDLCTWITNHTAKDAVVLVPPATEFANFTWMSERSTVANFKLLPQSKTGIIEWYHRLDDLSAHSVLQTAMSQRAIESWQLGEAINTAYNRLTTPQVEALMTQYRTDYVVTQINHALNLPVAYRNQAYWVYKKKQK